MATLALSLAGQFVGAAIGGPFGATIGRALGALAGAAVDDALFGEKRQAHATGADIRLTGSSEGIPIPRLYGWARLSGNIIWATELEELTDEAAGSKGFGGPDENESTIAASFAVAFSEGEVTHLGRIWADGQILDTAGLSVRFYRGSETQETDSLIEAVQGTGAAPAYRGVCYLVFERLPLASFGNRIPNIAAELCRVVGDLEPAVRAINVIPGAGEYAYDPTPRVRILSPGATAVENTHQSPSLSDWSVSIDELQTLYPNLEHVALVIAWFGDDLRCGQCAITPRHEGPTRIVEGTTWSVAGWTRDTAPVVSTHEGGPAYGGTPSDSAVLAAIADLKARGLGVTLYPLIMMDIPADNPMGQPAYPWRGRISSDPAQGEPGSPDGTAEAAAQIAGFVPDYRAFILHYAGLASAAGGVDAIIIGSEMRGLSFLRGEANSFPFVEALVDLAGDVRAIVGAATKITYAADWSEFSGYQPGGGEKFFHLDPLWSSGDIDAVAIDNYVPAADWRDGTAHADAQAFDTTYEVAYLRANIAGGEGHDWYYASDPDRIGGLRSAITDGGHDEPWVWRFKDLAGWWSNPHHDRPGGVRSATPTAWMPQSKPIWFTELGCGAVDKGANQPNVFGDRKSTESARPYFSSGAPDALMQRQFLRAHFEHWADDAANPESSVFAGRMVELSRIYPWAWDARPYPAFPARLETWSDGVNHPTGHWLTGRAGVAASDEIATAVAADYGVALAGAEAHPPLLHGLVVDGGVSCRDALAPVLAVTGLRVRDSADGLRLRRPAARNMAAATRDEIAEGERPLVSRRRPDPSEATGTLALAFFDRERDYLAGSVTAMRFGGGRESAEGVPLVLDIAGARRAAEQLLCDRAALREVLEFELPPSMARVEAGDVIAVEGQGDGPFEIVEVRDRLTRQVSAHALPPVIETAIVADRPRTGTTAMPPARSLPVLVAAHLPPDPGDPVQSQLALAASASPWPGRVLVNAEATGASIVRLEQGAWIGELTSALARGPAWVWDRNNAIELRLYAGHLSAATEEAVLAGANRLAIRTEAGTWEIVGFAEADLIAPGEYRLSRLLRGQVGTEPAAAAAGSRVLVLDSRAARVGVPAAWVGAEVGLRAYGGASDPTGTAFSVDLALDPLLPLAPVHLRAWRPAGSGDIAFSWTRRSRADADSWATVDAPLDNVPEQYRLTVFDGAAPVRAIDADGPAATYAAADQLADFGELPAGFEFSVAQVSALYGSGHPATGHFNG